MDLTPKEMALTMARIADEKKALDIRVLEIETLTVLADYFVIATGSSTTHLRTLSEEMELKLKEQDVWPHHVEGRQSNTWVLLDYGSVVAHLFLSDTRNFYSLERLWGDAKQIEF
jgi:ribosome-associated protein